MDKHIRQLEEKLLQPHIRQSATAVADLLADSFIEYGQSGRIYDKKQTVAGLQIENPTRITMSNFKTTTLAPGVILANYLSTHTRPDGAVSHALRSSIWQQMDGRWQMLFHQGTLTKTKGDADEHR